MSMNRIVIVGTTCSGKSTLAKQFSQLLEIPHVMLDELYWNPHWQEKPASEFRAAVAQATSAPRWIVDGNYQAVRDLIWERADTLIWLNYSLPLVFLRGLRRSVRRAWTRETLFAGNRESFRQTFASRDSILLWLLRTHGKHRRKIPRARDEAHQHLSVHELRGPRETERFLKEVSPKNSGELADD